ncbi:arginase family protein [Solirubrobacter ginsenosidimutans]|uniref:Arginase family protein n=1 Tax=Solirubrobacter ginsenosidimutans TaxID=490573 RepID=A0A9X3S3G9_9ACTN|nr:arginase family protein [Solirubrobacter ginsenosidimutans]MDA0159493.1 arginase family protein [Solirubrobacter ginsenosidimutans]
MTFTVLDAPCNLGLRPPAPGLEPGVRRLADALRACGLVKRLGAQDAGRVDAPAYVSVPVNRAALSGYTRVLADRVGELVDAGARPLVLGGDCSILLGAMLALRRRARHGLVHVDGHLDFRHPGWSGGIGAVAGEDLAGVTGRLEAELSDLDGLGPYVLDADTVHMGDRERWPEEVAAVAETGITALGLDELRARGPVVPAVPYWVHVDADVLDSALLPAVDSPAPGGLTFEELSALLRTLLEGPVVGVQITVFDPDLDPDGTQASALSDCLVTGLGDRA